LQYRQPGPFVFRRTGDRDKLVQVRVHCPPLPGRRLLLVYYTVSAASWTVG